MTESISTTSLDLNDYWIDPTITMWDDISTWLATIWIIYKVVQLILYILTAWWLFQINKKLWEKYAWLSFVPILQIYSYFTASKKPSFYYFWLPIILLFVASFTMLLTFWISMIIYLVYVFILVILFNHAISKRCWRWGWTTVWLTFIPFIMFPIVWYKLKPQENNNNLDNEPKNDWINSVDDLPTSNEVISEESKKSEL